MEVQLPRVGHHKLSLYIIIRDCGWHPEHSCPVFIDPDATDWGLLRFKLCQLHPQVVGKVIRLALTYYSTQISHLRIEQKHKNCDQIKLDGQFNCPMGMDKMIADNAHNITQIQLSRLNFSQFSPHVFQYLLSCTKVRELVLTWCSGLGDELRRIILGACANGRLTHLTLSHCKIVDNDFLCQIARHLSKLVSLYTESINLVTARGLIHVLNQIDQIPDRSRIIVRDTSISNPSVIKEMENSEAELCYRVIMKTLLKIWSPFHQDRVIRVIRGHSEFALEKF